LPITSESLPLSHLTTPWQNRGSSRTSGSGCGSIRPRRRNSEVSSGASFEDNTEIEEAVAEIETEVTETYHEGTAVPPNSDTDDNSEYNPEFDEVIIIYKLHCMLHYVPILRELVLMPRPARFKIMT
jgi:hypothetical protein